MGDQHRERRNDRIDDSLPIQDRAPVGSRTLTEHYGATSVAAAGTTVWQNAGAMEETLAVIAQDPAPSSVAREVSALASLYRECGLTDVDWIGRFLAGYRDVVAPRGRDARERDESAAAGERNYRVAAVRAVSAHAIPSVEWAIDRIRGARLTAARHRVQGYQGAFAADRAFHEHERHERDHRRDESLYVRARDVLAKIARLDHQQRAHNHMTSDAYNGGASAALLRSLEPLRVALVRPEDDPDKYLAVWDALYGRAGGPPAYDDHTFGPLIDRPRHLTGTFPTAHSARGRLMAFPLGSDPAHVVDAGRRATIENLEHAADIVGMAKMPWAEIASTALHALAAALKYAGNDINGPQFLAHVGTGWINATIGGKWFKAIPGGEEAAQLFRRALFKSLWKVASKRGPELLGILTSDRDTAMHKVQLILVEVPKILAEIWLTAVTTMVDELLKLPAITRDRFIQGLIKTAQEQAILPLIKEQLNAVLSPLKSDAHAKT